MSITSLTGAGKVLCMLSYLKILPIAFCIVVIIFIVDIINCHQKLKKGFFSVCLKGKLNIRCFNQVPIN